MFSNLLESYKTSFDQAGDKDEVDATVTSLLKNLRNNYNFRANQLDDIINANDFGGLPRVENLRSRYAKDYERLQSKIGQLGDKRKAQMDRAEANAAKAVFDTAKLVAETAGVEIAKFEQLRLMAIDDLAKETDAEKKETIAGEIAGYERDIAKQTAAKAAADKAVTRLREAKENSDKLAAVSDEIAAAKEGTDTIVADLTDARELLFANIAHRESLFFEKDQEIDTLEFEAGRETDEKKKREAVAVWEAATASRAEMATQNQNDERLAKQYEVQIRAVQNSYLITYAILNAEKVNAQLMVLIKNDMNLAEDIAEAGEEKLA